MSLAREIEKELIVVFNRNGWNLEHLDGCVEQVVFDSMYSGLSFADVITEWEKDTKLNYDSEMR